MLCPAVRRLLCRLRTKEGKVEGLPRYRRPGIKAVRYTEKNGTLQMVHESL